MGRRKACTKITLRFIRSVKEWILDGHEACSLPHCGQAYARGVRGSCGGFWVHAWAANLSHDRRFVIRQHALFASNRMLAYH